jgi:hypothetical protein
MCGCTTTTGESASAVGERWVRRCHGAQHRLVQRTAVLNDEERTSAIGGDNAETAERIRDGSDARAASGMHAAAMWVLWSAKELSCVPGNNTNKRKRALVVERLAGRRELWFYVGTGRFFPAGAEVSGSAVMFRWVSFKLDTYEIVFQQKAWHRCKHVAIIRSRATWSR